jgi:mycothiol synthase
MIENGELGSWERERFQQILSTQPIYSGQQFVFNGDNIVACAGAYLRSQNGSQSWEIGWIATDPNYFGMGLGSHVIIRAIRFARFHQPHPIFLLTDDFRIPAISLYLKIGFYPSVLNEKRIISRWMKILNELREPEAEMLAEYIKNRHK